MEIPEIDRGGRRLRPTPAELAFAEALGPAAPGLDYWLHQDEDGTPWLLVLLDFVLGNVVRDTLRLDFDEAGIRGGWSPAFLNWDDGVRAEQAGISAAPPDGISVAAGLMPPAGLAALAARWFEQHRGSWEASERATRWRPRP